MTMSYEEFTLSCCIHCIIKTTMSSILHMTKLFPVYTVVALEKYFVQVGVGD